MQKVAAYVLERRDGLRTPGARKSEGEQICTAIEAWLRAKGATGDDDGGAYRSEDGSTAKWSVHRISNGDRSLTVYNLDETSEEGRRFSASLSVTVGLERVVLYVTLEVGSVATQVKPIEVDPRCPRVVRDLIELPGAWYHGKSRLRRLTHVEGFDDGEALAEEIVHEERTIPYIVVSLVSGHPALQRLDDRLAYDLAGLANVFTVDEDASWALTATLGKRFSCFSGAIRVYWPQLDLTEDPHRHPLWTAQRLVNLNPDAAAVTERFRRQMRRMIMRASAVSSVRPREIDEIRIAAIQARFDRMRAEAESLEDYQALAESYAEDNEELRDTLRRLEETNEALEARCVELERKIESLQFHLRQAKPELGNMDDDGDLIEPDTIDDEENPPPEPGEVRFYKKVGAAPGHDIMVRVGGCNHNSWQGAPKADKAKKGIAKLEGRDDWQSIQHCARCTGGGMWRVRW